MENLIMAIGFIMSMVGVMTSVLGVALSEGFGLYLFEWMINTGIAIAIIGVTTMLLVLTYYVFVSEVLIWL